MQEQRSKNPLERLLGLFTEVRSGEATTALLLTFNIFLILTSYYIAKVVREPLILLGGGAEAKAYTSAAQAILLLGALSLYSRMAQRFPRRQLIRYIILFFTACLVVFFILVQVEPPYLGVVFFIWVGIFSLMVIAQFWGFANDVYSPAEGRRLFVIVAFGASAGSVFGSWISKVLIEHVGFELLLLVCAGLLLLSLVFTLLVDSREKDRAKDSSHSREPDEPIGKEGVYRLVFTNKYLLLIGLMVLFVNWVNTTGEYVLSEIVSGEANRMAVESGPDFSAGNFIGSFYANFFFIVNLVGLVVQLLLVSRILKYLGVKIAILFLPIIAMGGYFLIAFFPVLSIIRWAKTAENATDYSLNNTVRHVLFLPTTREEKYKAKVAIDSLFWRAGDVLSALLVYVGVNYLLWEVTGFAIANLILVIIWIVLAVAIGRKHRQLVQQGNDEGLVDPKSA